jgi:hypothetical protein
MGQRIISLKTESWRGKSTLNVNDRLERSFLKMENCYVSSDGAEIRHFPGFITLLDLTYENNPDSGYARYVTDGVKPIFETSPTERYQLLSYQENSRMISLRARAQPTHLHGFEQVGDTLLIWGESRFRETPLLSSARTARTITRLDVIGNKWYVTLSGDFEPINLLRDAVSCGYNGIRAGNVVYIENVQVSDPEIQAIIDVSLNNKMHEVKDSTSFAIANAIVLHTEPQSVSPSLSITNVTATGEIHRVRYNRSNSYATPGGLSVYAATPNDRPDDPQALTSWRVIKPIDPDDISPECYPAWVANRTRDFGDGLNYPSTNTQDTEGFWLDATGTRGISRREQRPLPFRTNPEPAQDRLILAAPGYGCLFQIPLKVPINPENWPNTPFVAESDTANYGLWHHANDIYDKPRSLGLPKARLIDSIFTPALESPSATPLDGFNFNAIPVTLDTPSLGLPAGEYLVSIAFEDEALNEEGLASEPITVTIPANNYAYTIGIHYIHPGYVMPECMATKVNVYIAPPGESAMAFYTSFPLGARPFLMSSVLDTNYDASARYGFPSCSPADQYAFYRQWQLPLPDQNSNLSEVIDATRLAPQSASMPRGAEAARYIKGVLIAGGHTGNTGGSLQLWESRASIVYNSNIWKNYDEMIIRRNSRTSADPDAANVDGDHTTSTLGVAGRAFPDAYSGIEVTSQDLFPSGNINQQIDKVLNPRSRDFVNDVNGQNHHWEFLKLTKPIVGYKRDAGSPEGVPAQYTRYNRSVWYRMQKGQIQIGDPGAPHRANKAAIQFIDPNKGDDVTAIGTLAGSAIICSRRETYSFSWYRAPGGEVPQLVSNEHGCIGANTMVEFDGGLAWIGERGPVAMGSGLQWVGEQIAEDFYGRFARYKHDSKGMMRHSWACHDASRGIIMWGMVTDNGASVTDETTSYSWNTASDELRSRWPCDEVLIWSYRVNAFSTWRPPTGLEVIWMRQIRVASGDMVTAFLAADGRIYGLYDDKNDTTRQTHIFTATAKGSASTSLTLSVSDPYVDGENGLYSPLYGRAQGFFFRQGMLVEQLNSDGEIVGEFTISSIDSKTTTSITLTLSAAATWDTSTQWRVGGRQKATLVSTFMGTEAMDNLSVQAVQMRYNLHGLGTANAKLSLIKPDYLDDNTSAVVVRAGGSRWYSLGESNGVQSDTGIQGRRRRFQDVGMDGEEIAVKLELSGTAQCRITDIGLEVQ